MSRILLQVWTKWSRLLRDYMEIWEQGVATLAFLSPIMTKRETVLIDSVRKKTDILKDIIKELGLSEQVEVFNGRLEELSWERPGAFSVLTARALSQMASLMELAAPLLALDGRLICYKANVSEEELQLATSS